MSSEDLRPKSMPKDLDPKLLADIQVELERAVDAGGGELLGGIAGGLLSKIPGYKDIKIKLRDLINSDAVPGLVWVNTEKESVNKICRASDARESFSKRRLASLILKEDLRNSSTTFSNSLESSV